MLNKLLFLLFFQPLFIFSYTCSPQLQPSFNKILALPEAKDLLSQIEREGPIRLVVHKHSLSEKFGAFWDMDGRTICVNYHPRTTEGEIIGSILFELHNAAANKRLHDVDKLAMAGKITRETYIRSIEQIEYENSLKASLLTKKGISLGLFPRDAYLFTYSNFEEHYFYQKKGGHSAWIGQNFDTIVQSL